MRPILPKASFDVPICVILQLIRSWQLLIQRLPDDRKNFFEFLQEQRTLAIYHPLGGIAERAVVGPQ